MPSRRNYLLSRLREHKSEIMVGIGSFLLGAVLASSCRGPASQTQEPERPYPVTSQVYQIKGINNGLPFLATEMSDRREEISFANNAEGKLYINTRKLEKQDVDGTKEKWTGIKRDITSKMREAEVMKSK